MSIAKAHQPKNIKRKQENDLFKDLPIVENVIFLNSLIEFHLTDKRIITIPLNWISKLENASLDARNAFTIRGHFVFWDEIDEIIGVKNLLNGSIVPRK